MQIENARARARTHKLRFRLNSRPPRRTHSKAALSPHGGAVPGRRALKKLLFYNENFHKMCLICNSRCGELAVVVDVVVVTTHARGVCALSRAKTSPTLPPLYRVLILAMRGLSEDESVN